MLQWIIPVWHRIISFTQHRQEFLTAMGASELHPRQPPITTCRAHCTYRSTQRHTTCSRSHQGCSWTSWTLREETWMHIFTAARLHRTQNRCFHLLRQVQELPLKLLGHLNHQIMVIKVDQSMTIDHSYRISSKSMFKSLLLRFRSHSSRHLNIPQTTIMKLKILRSMKNKLVKG